MPVVRQLFAFLTPQLGSLFSMTFSASLLGFGLFLIGEPARAVSPFSCDCPRLECTPCEEQVSLEFVSDKCGPGLSQTRSCAKPLCQPLADAPASCSQVQKARADRSVASTDQYTLVPIEKPIGKVRSVHGAVRAVLPSGEVLHLKAKDTVEEGVLLETSVNSRVALEFADGNQVQLAQGSQLKLKEYETEKFKKRRAVLELLKGKVRAQVKKKAQGKTSDFRVFTKGAVAGVRGTDFVVSITDLEGRLETRVETLEGHVVLSDRAGKESSDILGGQGASYIIAKNEGQAFSDHEIAEFVNPGHLTPVYELSAEDVAQVEIETRGGKKKSQKRALASVKSAPAERGVCKKPVADFNQCSWTCRGNPRGTRDCQTDRPGVSCVRARCNAQGEWVDELRLPAGAGANCSGGAKAVVRSCDY